jgi:DNA-binding transcriptional ArsR family regulator
MDEMRALDCLAALSQPTRLKAFRLLVAHEPDGIAAGEIARLADVPQNTMSAHLATLAQSGLVNSERQSRSVVYRADLERFKALLVFLLQDCCGGRPDICSPILTAIEPCCPPRKSKLVKRPGKQRA